VQVASWLYDKSVVDSIFEAAPERYATRRNDFTKMFPTLSRRGDNAQARRCAHAHTRARAALLCGACPLTL
jgi:ribosomal protein L17